MLVTQITRAVQPGQVNTEYAPIAAGEAGNYVQHGAKNSDNRSSLDARLGSTHT